MHSRCSRAARTGTPRPSSPRAESPPGTFGMKRRQATSASTSASQRRWRIFRSAVGRTASSACCTARGATASSSIRTRKSWSSGGRASGRENSDRYRQNASHGDHGQARAERAEIAEKKRLTRRGTLGSEDTLRVSSSLRSPRSRGEILTRAGGFQNRIRIRDDNVAHESLEIVASSRELAQRATSRTEVIELTRGESVRLVGAAKVREQSRELRDDARIDGLVHSRTDRHIAVIESKLPGVRRRDHDVGADELAPMHVIPEGGGKQSRAVATFFVQPVRTLHRCDSGPLELAGIQ